MHSIDREFAIQAVDILNDFIGDCVVSVMVLIEYRRVLSDDETQVTSLIAVNKMCLSYLIITLNKWLEFYDKYLNVLPNNLRQECKALTREIKRRKVVEFRNKCVGHIWDKSTKRPLYNSEINERLGNIIGDSISDFLYWINNPDGNEYPKTVVSIIEAVRDQLVKNYSIKYDEIKER